MIVDVENLRVITELSKNLCLKPIKIGEEIALCYELKGHPEDCRDIDGKSERVSFWDDPTSSVEPAG